MASAQHKATIGDIDGERARLRKMLRGKDAKMLNRRPPNGTWSIVEHVRHLLFAEQAHLGGFLPKGFEWSPMGEGGSAGRKLKEVGTRPSKDIGEVFAEWDRIHRPIRAAIRRLAMKSARRAEAERALWGNHRHLNTHIVIIERLLQKFDS
jgi:hypothetical protein